MLIQLQVPEKQERYCSLITISQWVILDDQLQKVCSSGGYIGIKQLIAKALLDSGFLDVWPLPRN